MSSPSNVDLESVLNVHRRRLASISETSKSQHYHRYLDTIYLKRENQTNSICSFESKIFIFGDLQFLCCVFERYTSNIIVDEESIESGSNKTSFSTTFEENENLDVIDEDSNDHEIRSAVSKLRETSISTQSLSPAPSTGSPPIRRKKFSSLCRSQTAATLSVDHWPQGNLEGKRYGCIQLPTMKIIEVLEIFFRIGLDLIDVTNDFDSNENLHQNFIFVKNYSNSQKFSQHHLPRSFSFVGN